MNKKRFYIIISILALAIGFASISTVLLINGTATVSSNLDDFKVIFDKTIVNGIEDNTIIKTPRQIEFNANLSKIDETYTLKYEIKNASTMYDAKVSIDCSGSSEYLSITNIFNENDMLTPNETRLGTLTIKQIKSYAGDDNIDVNINCTINGEAKEKTIIE